MYWGVTLLAAQAPCTAVADIPRVHRIKDLHIAQSWESFFVTPVQIGKPRRHVFGIRLGLVDGGCSRLCSLHGGLLLPAQGAVNLFLAEPRMSAKDDIEPLLVRFEVRVQQGGELPSDKGDQIGIRRKVLFCNRRH